MHGEAGRDQALESGRRRGARLECRAGRCQMSELGVEAALQQRDRLRHLARGAVVAHEIVDIARIAPRDIRRVFSWQGFLINAVGAVAGLVIGLTLVWLQDRFGLVRLEGAMVPAYPVALRFGDVAGVLLVVLGVGGTFSAAMVAYLVRRMAPDAA